MAYRSSSKNAGQDFNATPNTAVPTGAAAGDIMILLLTGDVGSDISGTTPSGFTNIVNDALTVDGQEFLISWKRLTGADTGSYTFGVLSSGHTNYWGLQAFCFSGRDSGNPPVVSTSNLHDSLDTSPMSALANGVTALAGDDLLWATGLDAVDSSTITTTPPTGYTLRQDGSATSFNYVAGATKDNVSAGATGTVTGTITYDAGGTGGWAAWLVRIPVAPAVTTKTLAALGVG